MRRTIEVNIDRLVLRGIDPSDRKALVEGLQAELSRVLAEPESSATEDAIAADAGAEAGPDGS